MHCDPIRSELIPFHFGSLDPEPRASVEAHLLGCAPCLRTFLALKHHIDLGEDTASPSLEARERLRRAVVDELRAAGSRSWRWWQRPVAFAVAVAAAVVAVLAVHAVATGPGVPPRGLEDPSPLHSPDRKG